MINNRLEISDQNRKLVMSIERDRIWVDPTVSVDETAEAVIDALREYIVNMVDAAVKEEREACAKACESAGPGAGPIYCAFAIRERGAP